MAGLNTQVTQIVKDLVRPEIRELNSYHVPDASGFLKLDAMENPNAWPGELTAQWLERMKKVEANRYPDPAAGAVKAQMRSLLGLQQLEQTHECRLDILLGNGSDEIIQMLAMALARPGACIMAPEPGFVMYNMIARFVGMRFQGVDLEPDFSLDTEKFIAAINQHDPALIFLAVPNNPTGNVFSPAAVRAIVEASRGLVVIDEAYMAFTDSDLLALAAEYPNVVVMRTFSKVGLAGLRLGFLVGAPAWISELDKLRLPYNINSLTQLSVEFAIENYALFNSQTSKLREARSELESGLREVCDLEVFSSEANFILVRCKQKSARAVFDNMKEQGVLVKCLDGAHPLLAGCLRLTVGSREQNDVMLKALSSALDQV